MDRVDNNYLLAVMGLIAIILEVLLGAPTGFDLLLLGLIFVVGGGVGILTANFINALIVIVVLSFLYVVFGRKVIKQKLNVTTTKTNTENLISKKAVVTKTITADKPGQVKIEGEIWRAEADQTIEVGNKVVLESLSGVTFKVTPV